jgi:hypothetical protein
MICEKRIFDRFFLLIQHLNNQKLKIMNFYLSNPSLAFHRNDTVHNLKRK